MLKSTIPTRNELFSKIQQGPLKEFNEWLTNELQNLHSAICDQIVDLKEGLDAGEKIRQNGCDDEFSASSIVPQAFIRQGAHKYLQNMTCVEELKKEFCCLNYKIDVTIHKDTAINGYALNVTVTLF